jgi:hypothetical protein
VPFAALLVAALMVGSALAGSLVGAGCAATGEEPAPSGPIAGAEAGGDPVLVGAGDIAVCGAEKRTARLLDGIAGTIFTAGDNAYYFGTYEEFERCYAPSWGRHRARTRPSPGNHDYRTEGAAGYFTYFGSVAGDPRRGYYSYDLGTWHVLSLNSDCTEIGGCRKGSAEEKWVQADLAAHPARCTAAYWHHPLFSSGLHLDKPGKMRDIWIDLYEAGAEVVMNGHDHDYERFAPQDPWGRADPERGIREFVVGTGGAHLRSFQRRAIANSQTRSDKWHGVLKLTLHADSYDWEFIPEAGGDFTDSGSSPCH